MDEVVARSRCCCFVGDPLKEKGFFLLESGLEEGKIEIPMEAEFGQDWYTALLCFVIS